MRGILRFKLVFLFCMLFLTGTVFSVSAREQEIVVDQKLIDTLTQQTIQILLERQQENGSFDYGRYTPGATALVVYALESAGLPKEHPGMTRALAYLDKAPNSNHTYTEALILCALAKADPLRYKRRIEMAMEFLCQTQTAAGSWGYGRPVGNYADNSNAQYAVLGLAAAADAGFPVPPEIRRKAIAWFTDIQNPDGGWSYLADWKRNRLGRFEPRAFDSTFSMTCAGVSSLRLFGVEREEPVPDKCGKYTENAVMVKGLQYLDMNFAGFLRDFSQSSFGYYILYGLERVAILNGIKEVGGANWYKEGCFTLLRNIESWRRDTVNLAFGLLFIAKNAAPYAIGKLRWNGDWNPDRYDVPNWTKLASETLKTPLDWLVADLKKGLDEAGRSSMIFISGHGKFNLSRAELDNLKRFLDAGGMVVGEPCCNDKLFALSFRRLMEREFGHGKKFQTLAPGHPVYDGRFKLNPKDVGAVYNLRAGCVRTPLFLLENEISCALNGDRTEPEKTAQAKALSINLLDFALSRRRAHGKFETVEFEKEPLKLEDLLRQDAVKGSGAVYRFENPVGRIVYDGEWDSDPNLFVRLGAAFRDRPELPVFDAQIPLEAQSEDLSGCQILYLSGHGAPVFQAPVLANLRRYLSNGGKLLIEACCTDPAFNDGARRLVRELYPEQQLQEIPLSDPVYVYPYKLSGREIAVSSAWKNNGWEPRIRPFYGVRGMNGEWILIYVPYDISCSVEGEAEEDAPGVRREDALMIWANVLYALLNAKEDGDEQP